jgi:hypothetical protein
MADESLWQRLLGDPLRDITRKERRALLGVSVAAILVAETGIIPRKIEAVGIEFLSDNRPTILLLLAFVVLYFFIAFVIYAASDLIVWQRSYFEVKDHLEFKAAERHYLAEESGAKNVVIGIEALPPKWLTTWHIALSRSILPTSVLRAIVEFLLPCGVAAFAFVSVIRAAYAVPQGGIQTTSGPAWLNGAALCIGFLAALFLAFSPPPPAQLYTKGGAAQITWTGRVTRWGKVQWWLSYTGPFLLALAFALQFITWLRG